MQIKTQRGTIVFSLEWLRLVSLTIPSVGKDVEELELLCAAGGNVEWHDHFGKPFDSLLKS